MICLLSCTNQTTVLCSDAASSRPADFLLPEASSENVPLALQMCSQGCVQHFDDAMKVAVTCTLPLKAAAQE